MSLSSNAAASLTGDLAQAVVTPATPRNQPAGKPLVLLLTGLSTLGAFSIDTYLPSLHAIGRSFAATPAAVQQTLTVYLVAFAVMTLWHGAISDSFGRRPVILVGVAAFTLTSLGCALAQSLPQLVFWRAMQGLCAGAGIIVARALIRDLYDGAAAQRLMAKVAVIFAIAPAIAPVIGGLLQQWFGWRAVFVFLTLIGAALWIACARYLPESLPVSARQPFKPARLWHDYGRVLSHPAFVLVSSVLALAFCAFFLYILSAPMFLMTHLGLRESQFFWQFGPVTCGLMLGSWLCGRAAGRVDHRQQLRRAFFVMLGAALLNVLLNAMLWPAPPSPFWAILPLPIYACGMAMATPALTLIALDYFPAQRGMAASCQSFIQMLCGGLFAGIVAPLLWGTTLGLALGMMGVAITALGLLLLAWRKRWE